LLERFQTIDFSNSAFSEASPVPKVPKPCKETSNLHAAPTQSCRSS
jgi:hypothetical protein